MRHLLLSGAFALLLTCSLQSKEQIASPLRVIPADTDIVIQVDDPRKLIESFTSLDIYKQLRKLPIVDELFQSTQAQQIFQIVSYYEKAMKSKWPTILDQVAGNGIVLGVKLGNKPRVILAIEGQSADKSAEFKQVLLKVIEREIARKGGKGKIPSGQYQGVEAHRLGDAIFVQHGSTMILASDKDAGMAAVDLLTGKKKKSMIDHAGLARSKKMLPDNSLIRAWVNFRPVREIPDLAMFFGEKPNPIFNVAVGNWLDVLRRTPFICAGLSKTDRGFHLAIRIPRGSKGMSAVKSLFLPDDEKAPKSRPLLLPKGTIFSTSFYWDISQIWHKRKELLGTDAKALDMLDEQAKKIPFLRVSPSEIAKHFGSYHRLVVLSQTKSGYKKYPKQTIPAIAFVTEPRDLKKFRRSVRPALIGAGLFVTRQINWSLEEKEYRGCKIIGYRFDEKTPVPGDENNLRFNASPCFFTCENQFVICSTLEAADRVIDAIKAEKKSDKKGSQSVSKYRAFAAPAVSLIPTDQLITGLVLSQGSTLNEAKKQIQELLKVIRSTGGVAIDEQITPNQFSFNIRILLTQAK